jgi:hypothetical protein
MGARVVDWARLESVCTARYRGFESLPIRSKFLNFRLVLVLDESAFSAAQRARLSRDYFFRYSDFEDEDDDEHEEEWSILEFRIKATCYE